MDRITPLDLEAARFPIVRKGYDTDAVDALLRTAASELGSMIREIQELRSRHETDRRELELFRQRESTLADALILAQKTADETRAMAHKEAELIVAHAKRQAEDLRRDAQDQAGEIERSLDKRIQEKKNFEARFRSLLHEYLRPLEDSPKLVVNDRDTAVGE